MPKTILITGATDGIGLETAIQLGADGHRLLLHGRNKAKLDAAMARVSGIAGGYVADLSKTSDVLALADAVTARGEPLDVLINNAGVLKAPDPQTAEGRDIRFMVNTIAPYILTRRLLSILASDGRVVNVSSAAQSPVNLEALTSPVRLGDMEAYAQSKLAITMWTNGLTAELSDDRVIVSVNPGSLLASKMVKEGFGISGNDLGIGADILCRAAVSDEFSGAAGKYFDNDAQRFGSPHADALSTRKVADLMSRLNQLLPD